MTIEEKYKITSNDYVDLYLVYNRNPKLLEQYEGATTHIINTRYAIAYVGASILRENFISEYGYASLPHLYGLLSERSLEDSGVYRIRRLPGFDLRGGGVLIAIIDTGIDYTNPIFIRKDGTSKIVALWDQTIDSENRYPGNKFYGTEYTNEDINEALKSEAPLKVVPSIDEIGHGTMLAGVAAGNEVPEQEFSGVAPDADLIVVKLKQAKQILKDFFEIPPNVPCYQENDLAWALDYVIETARKRRQPMSICIGLGTSQGSHDGRGPFDNTIGFYATSPGIAVTIGGGNEGSANRHFFSTIDPNIGFKTVELKVGENESGFTMELWGSAPNTYSIDMYSPSGEYISRIVESLRVNQEVRFILESTIILVDFQLVETHSGTQLIFLRFRNPAPGIWRFRIYSRGDLAGAFHIWLPMGGFISKNTYFLEASPYTTITSPGNTLTPITITAYNSVSNTIYLQASRGFTRTDKIKPDLAAPGDNIIVPTTNKGFINASGSSIAAAHAAGITAMLLEWGIVKENYPGIDSSDIKKYLIRGAKRDKRNQYPNREWGYGTIDLYNVFNALRVDFPS